MVTSNKNSIAERFKYNGIEQEEALGLNLYEMPLRQYDPAIARWTGIDPVTHHSMSTYTAFDNNPVFWADPSGANSVINWGNQTEAGAIAEAEVDYEYNNSSSGSCDDCSQCPDTCGGSNSSMPSEAAYAVAGGNRGSSVQTTTTGSNDTNSFGGFFNNVSNALEKDLSEDNSLSEGSTLRDGAVVSYGAAVVSSTPIYKPFLRALPSSIHGGYARAGIGGQGVSDFTSISSFAYRRLTGGGNAGRAIPGIFGRIGTGMMWGDALITGMMFESDSRINALYDANNASNPYSGFVFRGAGLLRIDWQGVSERRVARQKRYKENQKNNKYRGFVFD